MDWWVTRGIPEEDARRVMSGARRRRFGRNEIIFHQGDPAESLHLIAKGRIALKIAGTRGDPVTVAVAGRNDVVGEMALLDEGGHRSATAVALEPTETLSVHRDEFSDLRSRYPSVTSVLLLLCAERIQALDRRLVEALTVSAETRVRRRLVDLASLYPSDGADVVLPWRQEDLAGLAGTTRPTVNRVLRDEEKRGTLRLGRGRITLVDLKGIERRAK